MVQKLGIKKEQFMSIVGFYGNTALVDKKLLKRVKHMSIKTLIGKGFLFQAVASSVFDAFCGNGDEAQARMLCGTLHADNLAVLTRRFGVHEELLRNHAAYRIKFI